MSAHTLQWMSPLLFLCCIVLLWLAVTALVLRLSGWLTLERCYRAAGAARGVPVRLRAARLGRGLIGRFRNVLTLWVGNEGLQLHVLRLFGPRRSDLFFPWTDITVSRGHWYFSDYVELTFVRAPEIPLRIDARAAAAVQAAAAAHWPEAAARSVGQAEKS